jgi:signal transduction histidine kinase
MTAVHEETRRADRRADQHADQRVMLGTAGALGVVFAVSTSLQSVLVLGVFSPTLRAAAANPLVDLLVRIAINLGAMMLLVALAALLRPEGRRGPVRACAILGIGLVVSALRCVVQVATGIYVIADTGAILTEFGLGFLVSVLVLLAGLGQVYWWRRFRAQERERAAIRGQAMDALEALQREELRVRREVAQGLHGSMQTHFVLLSVELDHIAQDLSPERSRRVQAVARQLDELREQNVRALSAVLYPAEVDHGLDLAVRSLLARVPASIAIDARFDGPAPHLGEPGTDADALSIERRVLLVRVVEEGISNALRHGKADALLVRVHHDEPADRVEVAVDDNGTVEFGTVEFGAVAWSGLSRLGRQLEIYGGWLSLTGGGELGGARLAASLPLAAEAGTPRA